MEDIMDSLRAWLTRREGTIRLVLRDARVWVSRGRCRRGLLPRCGISTFTLFQVPPFPFVYVMLTRSFVRSFVIAGYAVPPLTSKQSHFFSVSSALSFFVYPNWRRMSRWVEIQIVWTYHRKILEIWSRLYEGRHRHRHDGRDVMGINDWLGMPWTGSSCAVVVTEGCPFPSFLSHSVCRM